MDFFSPAASFAYIEIRHFLKYSYVLKHLVSPKFSKFLIRDTRGHRLSDCS